MPMKPPLETGSLFEFNFDRNGHEAVVHAKSKTTSASRLLAVNGEYKDAWQLTANYGLFRFRCMITSTNKW